MTLSECLAQVESLKHNTVPEAMKLVWLTELDQRVIIDVLYTHALSIEEQAEVDGFTPYTSESDDSTILLIPDPFSEIYRYWLMARIDEVNRDSAYTNNITQFNRAWTTYANWYNRTHLPQMQVSHFRLDGGNVWKAIDPLS